MSFSKAQWYWQKHTKYDRAVCWLRETKFWIGVIEAQGVYWNNTQLEWGGRKGSKSCKIEQTEDVQHRRLPRRRASLCGGSSIEHKDLFSQQALTGSGLLGGRGRHAGKWLRPAHQQGGGWEEYCQRRTAKEGGQGRHWSRINWLGCQMLSCFVLVCFVLVFLASDW